MKIKRKWQTEIYAISGVSTPELLVFNESESEISGIRLVCNPDSAGSMIYGFGDSAGEITTTTNIGVLQPGDDPVDIPMDAASLEHFYVGSYSSTADGAAQRYVEYPA